jgi:sugar phosphate isomerase/epimerase
MLDVPDFAIRQLKLRGLNIDASMLAGWSLSQLDELRDRADKAACPCLLVVEDKPLPLATTGPKKRAQTLERIERLGAAAHRLGCNAIAIRCDAPNTDEAFELVANSIRDAMRAVERRELNVLLMPEVGLTQSPDRMTELIKRVGGFRIGSLPSFAQAASTGNVVDALRKLAPYAGAVHASVEKFSKAGEHAGYDLRACINAIRNVGFVNTVAIEYIGRDDAIANIELAREQLQAAIDNENA